MYNANRTIFLSLQQHSIQINTSGKIIDSFSIDNLTGMVTWDSPIAIGEYNFGDIFY